VVSAQQTRDAIVAAAIALFREKGFDATSIDEIAAAAEVSTRTFFRYFPTKEDVVFLDQSHEDAAFAREVADARPGEGDLDRLTRAAAMIARIAESNRAWFVDLYALVQSTPSLEARAARLQISAERVIVEALLGRGRNSRQRVERVNLLAACAVAALRASHAAWIAAGARGSADRIVADALAVLRHGFEPQAEGAPSVDSAPKRRSTGAR
jgi:AcrR family transcriptional regulator